ncbi:MAG: 3'-5' exoribonuclease [Spirochaetaceae bacterium]|jgi:DNA polymerase-3 subunit epsilon|nr:3'-5' exoribonuclease [Spirochaetaceae bacterium]GMO28923.1 MAG: 3'-5' exonuclease [Termitinemataceae bacterium]
MKRDFAFTALDFETASNNPNSVCQVGLVRVESGVTVEEYCALIQPPDNFIDAGFSSNIHGIFPEHTANAPCFAQSYRYWRHFIEDRIIVAHNIQFDYRCLYACLKEFCGITPQNKTYCTMNTWAGAFHRKSLDVCCAGTGVVLDRHHNALSDARACAGLFLAAIEHGRKLK